VVGVWVAVGKVVAREAETVEEVKVEAERAEATVEAKEVETVEATVEGMGEGRAEATVAE
jgi:hypothetical protein